MTAWVYRYVYLCTIRVNSFHLKTAYFCFLSLDSSSSQFLETWSWLNNKFIFLSVHSNFRELNILIVFFSKINSEIGPNLHKSIIYLFYSASPSTLGFPVWIFLIIEHFYSNFVNKRQCHNITDTSGTSKSIYLFPICHKNVHRLDFFFV